MSKVRLLNVLIDNLTMEEALENIAALIQDRKNAYVVTPNLDHLVRIERDTAFAKVYDNADLVLADGKPLIWLSKWGKKPIQEKISGSDLFPRLAEMAAQRGYTMYFLGAAEGVAEKAADNLIRRYPKLQIVGIYSPSIGFEHDPEQIKRIIENIKQVAPDILILALGSPKQEKFIYQYRKVLGVPVSLGLGASIDFVAGTVKRAPKWMSDHGLEWLYRTIQEPGRLAKRYFVDAIEMIPLLWKYRKR